MNLSIQVLLSSLVQGKENLFLKYETKVIYSEFAIARVSHKDSRHVKERESLKAGRREVSGIPWVEVTGFRKMKKDDCKWCVLSVFFFFFLWEYF